MRPSAIKETYHQSHYSFGLTVGLFKPAFFHTALDLEAPRVVKRELEVGDIM